MATIKANPEQEITGRRLLRQYGFEVESVAWVQRGGDEFAALVIDNNDTDLVEKVEDLFTTPNFPLEIIRERVGRYETRIFVGFAKIG